ncbi:PEP-CTERM sorting domain-containing protein [Paremcibacter congregatus]|nr:PEP-CTERM sorting domain-containing protein [Paremcibacter congregatus]
MRSLFAHILRNSFHKFSPFLIAGFCTALLIPTASANLITDPDGINIAYLEGGFGTDAGSPLNPDIGLMVSDPGVEIVGNGSKDNSFAGFLFAGESVDFLANSITFITTGAIEGYIIISNIQATLLSVTSSGDDILDSITLIDEHSFSFRLSASENTSNPGSPGSPTTPIRIRSLDPFTADSGQSMASLLLVFADEQTAPPVTDVSEPASLALLLIGAGGFLYSRRRQVAAPVA